MQPFVLVDSQTISSSRDVRTVEDQALLSAVPSWDYPDYARLCSGYYDSRQVLEMAVDGSVLSIYGFQERLMDTCDGAYARR